MQENRIELNSFRLTSLVTRLGSLSKSSRERRWNAIDYEGVISRRLQRYTTPFHEWYVTELLRVQFSTLFYSELSCLFFFLTLYYMYIFRGETVKIWRKKKKKVIRGRLLLLSRSLLAVTVDFLLSLLKLFVGCSYFYCEFWIGLLLFQIELFDSCFIYSLTNFGFYYLKICRGQI